MPEQTDKIITLQVGKLVFGGKALCHHKGMAVFVWNALPGETVRARITGRKRDYSEAEVIEILQRSPDRIEPAESHYLICSPWQVMRYEKEIEWKKEILRELFQRSFSIDIGEFDLLSGNPFEYRNKLELNFTYSSEGLLELAFYQREGRIKVPIEGCRLGSDAINVAATAIRDILRKRGITPGELKTLVLRSNRKGQVIGSLFVKRKDFPDLITEMEGVKGLKGFKIVYSDPSFSASVVSQVLSGFGQELLREDLLGRFFFYSELSFFQINPEMFEKLLMDIKSFVSPDDIVYDIYAGVGVIGLSTEGRYTYLVEIEEDSARLAELNSKLNRVSNCEVIRAKAEKYTLNIKPHSLVIFDPPRAGLSKKLIKRTLRVLPRRIIYVSCNPSTQARDVKMLEERYRIAFFRAYNFFPRTPHIESLMVLDLKQKT